MCAHREGAYPEGAWRQEGNLTNSEYIRDHGLVLPLFHEMSVEQQDVVVDALAAACRPAAVE